MGFLNGLYGEDIRAAAKARLPWEQLAGRNILIVGATGLLGKVLVDILMYKNERDGLGCHVYASGRSAERAKRRLCGRYFLDKNFRYLEWDVTGQVPEGLPEMDYILGMAGNTHPRAYSVEPIETILTTVYGTKNLLDICRKQGRGRFVFLSSVEIYGENRGDVELFEEHYLGVLDSNTLRAGYPEGKRCGESLCQAYRFQAGVDCVVARLPRVFGPTLWEEDSKAVSQFIHKALKHEDIVLKSDGSQHYSFLYAADAITGLLAVMLSGSTGEAYNVASEGNDATLREMAEIAAGVAGTKVVYGCPDEKERAGYSTATVARLDGTRIGKLGWKARYRATEALERTIQIMEENVRLGGGEVWR